MMSLMLDLPLQSCVSFWTGVCSAWTYSICCRIPANTGNWHGYHAGKDHDHQEGIHYICAGKYQCCFQAYVLFEF